MAITTDEELVQAALEAGRLLQEIQDYCGSDFKEEAKVRFPRGFLRTAQTQRHRLSFITDPDLKSNLAYTLILSDAVIWLLNRTDIAATAKEMLIKLFIFLGGSLCESITKEYLNGICGKGYKKRTKYLSDHGIIDDSLREDLDWVWDTRNNMHLFLLEEREYENDYNTEAQIRAAKTFKELVESLAARGRLQ